VELFLLLAAVIASIPFLLPIITWLSSRNTRSRVADLERLVERQQAEIDGLTKHLSQLRRDWSAEKPRAPEMPAAGAPGASAPGVPLSAPPPPSAVQPPPISPPRPTPPPSAPVASPRVGPATPRVAPSPPPIPPAPPVPRRETPEDASRASAADAATRVVPPEPRMPPPRMPPPPRPPVPPSPSSSGFDWESLVGVKLFSAIAGIALVIAAVSFLRYSIEHGWLEPPVRVAIGVIASVGLLVGCELKAARKYPVTANALDAAAIAILFSTFFAAHALWNLVGSATTFALLALVTAVAVLLSIRRDSLFIAVLGLLGGFATPVLLSTGENQPIPLFGYLLLLNVGLAWVAYRMRWAPLALLTVILTTLYQWGWVLKFLSVSQLPLAMAIFIVFPLAAYAIRMIHDGADEAFERTAVLAAVLPLLFAVYLAAVPAYGVKAGLLFGFLFLLDAGLFAIALARQDDGLHAVAGIATLVVFAVHRVNHDEPLLQILLFVSLFVAFYLAAPTIAARVERRFTERGRRTAVAAPLLLFVPATLAAGGEAASPALLFSITLVLVALVAWRAMAERHGAMYFFAVFFAVAGQAIWSATHLVPGRLGIAVAIYAAFGVLQLAAPLIARRWYGPFTPRAGAGVTLLASLLLLLFLAAGRTAPTALWGLALLLAILNAALFVESAAGALPLTSLVGSLLSWAVLAVWWSRAAADVGVLASLLVMTGLALVVFVGYAWANSKSGKAQVGSQASFANGLYLGLVGHLFLAFVALDRSWSLPPWPLFGTLLVLTLAASVVALATGIATLHTAAVTAAGVVLVLWSSVAAAAPWPGVALPVGAALAAYGVVGLVIARRSEGSASRHETAAVAAVIALFCADMVGVVAGGQGPAAPGVLSLSVFHAVILSVLLTVAWRERWHGVTVATVIPGALALLAWRAAHPASAWWNELLVFAGAIYAVLTGFPFVLGRRARALKEPYLLAILSSAVFFFAARDAFIAGSLRWAIGVVPVAEGAVMALLLRQLLRIEPAGQRDLGRLALVAGASLAFLTVAIPLQLKNQWITIGWAFEGAALAWLYTRISHRGLLYAANALLATAFIRLALNPAVFRYEPRGGLRVLNWYLYAYLLCAAAMFAAAWWLSKTDDGIGAGLPKPRHFLAAGGTILMFELLNIEIADFYAAGPEITFRFGATLAQDLTYTIGWLLFGMVTLAAGIIARSHAARVAAVVLIAITTFKCFLYDLGSLGGLYRVASFVGLGISLALVSLALQKYVLARPQEETQ
jgi:hypothetical protein